MRYNIQADAMLIALHRLLPEQTDEESGMANEIICLTEGCSNAAYAKGFCSGHYSRWRKHGVDMCKSPIREMGRGCSVPGCDNKHAGHGYCQNHMKKWKRYGDPEAFHPRWKARVNWVEENKDYQGGDCLKWPFSAGDHGRGTVQINGRQISAPRAMCIAAHGMPSDESLETAHSCGMGHEGCMNPRHLRWATKAENTVDRALHGRDRKGTQINTNKLSEGDVRSIRLERGRKSGVELAKLYGVTPAAISSIMNRKSWAWLED